MKNEKRAANLWAGGNLTEEETQLVREVCLEIDRTEKKQSMVEFLAIAKLTKEHGFPSAKASAAVKRYFTR